MKPSDVLSLKRGTIYLVKHRNNDKSASSRLTRRVFIGTENRFEVITCAVFSSRLPKKARIDVTDTTITYHGYAPASELSIPYYDLVEVKEAA